MMKSSPLIDTNLLLLFVIGSVDNGHFIDASKRLGAFSYDDYRLLKEFIDKFDNFATTPYILTEVSNLIDLQDYAAEEAFKTLRLVSQLAEVIDVTPSSDTEHAHFFLYGLTDVNILNIAQNRAILTNDMRLSNFAYGICPVDNIIPWYLVTSNQLN
ncbi:hypothetical protein DN614_32035 [Klebsiella michiganensis]|uniref:hypothetical protein n=1 Tax=Klebsiella TaxID=570 RepID=UPI000FEBA2CB|nr:MULTISPECIES: hypothetical protein [Klebsiella]MCD6622891.1 hypothetical protein [Klebsiella michiganensis]MDH0489659.1 hypothetical protein [Klebsiella michiganensis]RWS76214.1 hypothetical protein DN614_32035 [Klebsiella michiganensis]